MSPLCRALLGVSCANILCTLARGRDKLSLLVRECKCLDIGKWSRLLHSKRNLVGCEPVALSLRNSKCHLFSTTPNAMLFIPPQMPYSLFHHSKCHSLFHHSKCYTLYSTTPNAILSFHHMILFSSLLRLFGNPGASLHIGIPNQSRLGWHYCCHLVTRPAKHRVSPPKPITNKVGPVPKAF